MRLRSLAFFEPHSHHRTDFGRILYVLVPMTLDGTLKYMNVHIHPRDEYFGPRQHRQPAAACDPGDQLFRKGLAERFLQS